MQQKRLSKVDSLKLAQSVEVHDAKELTFLYRTSRRRRLGSSRQTQDLCKSLLLLLWILQTAGSDFRLGSSWPALVHSVALQLMLTSSPLLRAAYSILMPLRRLHWDSCCPLLLSSSCLLLRYLKRRHYCLLPRGCYYLWSSCRSSSSLCYLVAHHFDSVYRRHYHLHKHRKRGLVTKQSRSTC